MDQSPEVILNTIFLGGAILWTVLSSAVIYLQCSASTSSESTAVRPKPRPSQTETEKKSAGIELKFTFGKEPQRKKGFPPHLPGRYPIFGHIFANLFDPIKPHLGLTELAKKYGNIFSMQILQQNIVVVNELNLIKETLNNNAVSGRPFIFRIHYGFHGAKDIIFGTYNKKWAYMKKICAQGLRMFGCGSHLVDEIVQKETVALKEAMMQLSENGTQSFDPRICLLTSVVNGLTAAILGRRFDHDDPVMAEYKLTTRLFSESCSIVNGMELDLFPWLRFLPNKNFKKLTHARDLLDRWIDRELEEAKIRYKPDNPKCILDVLFETRNNHRGGYDEEVRITDHDIRSIFVDLLVSGTFTTAISLSTFAYLMMENPELQKDLQEEATSELGSRTPSGEDRKKMPLMEATILEILRYISHVPLNLPHCTLEDTTIGGYDVPKDTQVLLNLWATHHDPAIWKDPWRFNPRRFLDETGNILPCDHETRRSLIPFSAGRRACLGENLARERIFLFATTMVRNFEILPPEGCEAVKPCDPRDFDLGLILEPKPFKIKLALRNQ